MKTDLDTWLTFAVGSSETEPGGEEGGWLANDPSPDNPTWRGVEYKEACKFLNMPGMAADTFKTVVTRTVVGQIALENYWNVYKVDLLPLGVAILYMDQCWVGGGVVDLQMAMNNIFSLNLTLDGALGPMTLKAMEDNLPTANKVQLLEHLEAAAEIRYRSLDKFVLYGQGWLNRLHACAALA